MSDGPLVSVIVIFLDAAKFIREAVESIFAQTFDKWELLLVDDGSSDESTFIAKQYIQQYPEKIRYLEHADHSNRGMSASRNLGIAHAKGDYIAFLDADDIWLPTKLERQVDLLASHPQVAMVYGPAQWWYSWTGRQEDVARDFIHELGVLPGTLIQPPTLLTRFLRNEGISPCTCSILLRREAVEKVGGFETQFTGLYEDQAFFAKVCLTDPVYVSFECISRYRQHSESNYALTQEAGTYRAARQAFLLWLGAYLRAVNVTDQELWHALRSEMRPFRYPFLYELTRHMRQGLPGRAWRAGHRLRQRWLSLPILRRLRTIQLRRLQPLGNGRQQGTAIVRWYWSEFLQSHQADIHGRALEIGSTSTIRQHGGKALICAEAMDLEAHSPEVTVVADLSRADHVAPDQYDCFVNQFTMHLIYDSEAALYHAIRILKPGGVLLINFPCVDYYFSQGLDMGTGQPLFLYWWFTPIQVENLFHRLGLQSSDYYLKIYGNLFTRVAYQMNMPAEQLTRHELEHTDPGHPLLICARLVKPLDWQAEKPAYQDAWRPETVPLRWNPETGHYPPS